ncbi:hypothetical protein HK405_011022, partial [Cladochytrium tenue]
DDFRRLLATPRAVQQKLPKAAPTATPRGGGGAGGSRANSGAPEDTLFAKPEVPKRKKKEWKRPEPAEPTAPAHRDRAQERRDGANPDYEDSEAILERLSYLAAQADDTEADPDSRKAVYQQSKYLGGDVHHTHLVKGLDYALLRKTRAEMGDGQKLPELTDTDIDDKLESLLDQPSRPDESQATESEPETPFARRIREAVFHRPTIPARNEFFLPGRMAFMFDLDGSAPPTGLDPFVPTAMIRSKLEIKDVQPKSSSSDSDIVVNKVAQLIASLRTAGIKTADEDKKKLKRKDGAEDPSRQPVKAPVPGAPALDDDEDIFADAGRDYVLEAKKDKKPDQAGTSSNEASYFGNSSEDVLEQVRKEADDEQRELREAAAAKQQQYRRQQHQQQEQNARQNDESHPPIAAADGAEVTPVATTATATKPEAAKRSAPQAGLAFGARSSAFGDYGEDGEREFYDSDDEDGGGEGRWASAAAADMEQVDLGSKGNKRRQLTRLDFDTEEEFAKYKETQVHVPKAAFQ